jgi:hypothetical protein
MSREEPKLSQWSPLKCRNAPDGLKLYYDFSNTTTGMFVAVTDLRSIWEVSIDRDDIVDNAREQNCTIDPAESATQLLTLLNKLKQSLTAGGNDIGHSEYHGDGEKHEYLTLRTRLKLPSPLEVLQWTFRLLQRGEITVADAITFPLLREATILKQQMETLHQVIKDKDHVLAKLLDKIDNSAIDLTLIFPGISGLKSRKQRIDVAEASRHVPGMRTFDRKSWETGITRSHNGISSGGIDLSKILDCSRVHLTATTPSANWIQTLPSLDEHTGLIVRSGSDTDEYSLEAAIPMRRSPKATSNNSDSPTESDFEDLADTPRRRKPQIPQSDDPVSSPTTRRGPRTQPRSSSHVPAPSPRPALRKRRASDSSSSSDSEKATKRGGKATKKVASKIGMLGGKRKASPPRHSSPVAVSNVSSPSRKLGVLGGRRAPTKSPSKSPVPFRKRSERPNGPGKDVDSDTASSTSSTPASRPRPAQSPLKVATPTPVKEEKPEPEESVEEKAKRKRQELKRMQAEASAGLAKKKVRRF